MRSRSFAELICCSHRTKSYKPHAGILRVDPSCVKPLLPPCYCCWVKVVKVTVKAAIRHRNEDTRRSVTATAVCSQVSQLLSQRETELTERLFAKSPVCLAVFPDVKPSNVLINTQGQVKMCDFGISGYLVDSVAKTMDAGCKPYMAVSSAML